MGPWGVKLGEGYGRSPDLKNKPASGRTKKRNCSREMAQNLGGRAPNTEKGPRSVEGERSLGCVHRLGLGTPGRGKKKVVGGRGNRGGQKKKKKKKKSRL